MKSKLSLSTDRKSDFSKIKVMQAWKCIVYARVCTAEIGQAEGLLG